MSIQQTVLRQHLQEQLHMTATAEKEVQKSRRAQSDLVRGCVNTEKLQHDLLSAKTKVRQLKQCDGTSALNFTSPTAIPVFFCATPAGPKTTPVVTLVALIFIMQECKQLQKQLAAAASALNKTQAVALQTELSTLQAKFASLTQVTLSLNLCIHGIVSTADTQHLVQQWLASSYLTF